VTVANHERTVKIQVVFSCGLHQEPRVWFAAAAVIIWCMRAHVDLCDAATLAMDRIDHLPVNLGCSFQADNPSADGGLIRHNNDFHLETGQCLKGGRGSREKTEFLWSLYVIGPIHINRTVPIQENRLTATHESA